MVTMIEHAGKGVVILGCYPWRVELFADEVAALAVLVDDCAACRAARVLACRGDIRLAGLLAVVAGLPLPVRQRLVDECVAVVDRLSPPWGDRSTPSQKAVLDL